MSLGVVEAAVVDFEELPQSSPVTGQTREFPVGQWRGEIMISFRGWGFVFLRRDNIE